MRSDAECAKGPAQSENAAAYEAEIGSAVGRFSTPQQPAHPAAVDPYDPLNDLEPGLEDML